MEYTLTLTPSRKRIEHAEKMINATRKQIKDGEIEAGSETFIARFSETNIEAEIRCLSPEYFWGMNEEEEQETGFIQLALIKNGTEFPSGEPAEEGPVIGDYYFFYNDDTYIVVIE